MRRLFALVGILAAGPLGGQVVWRLSDPLGSDLGPARSLGAGWVLGLEPRTGGDRRTLYQDKTAQSVTLTDRDPAGRVTRLQEFREGDEVWEVAYDPQTGLPREETTFQDNRPVETASLEFTGRVLVSRSVRDPSGTLLYRDTLLRWPDGTLRRLERDGPDGPLAEVAWSYRGQGKLAGAWSAEGGAEGTRRVWTYTDAGTEESLTRGTEVLLSRVTVWTEAGASEETQTDPGTNKVRKRILDSRGRVVTETQSLKDAVVQTKHWTYDDQGRVVTALTEALGSSDLWTYAYTGTQVVGTQTRDGVTVAEETVQDGEKVQVRLYDRGRLFLEETWAGGKKTKETYYKDGQAVRERTR